MRCGPTTRLLHPAVETRDHVDTLAGGVSCYCFFMCGQTTWKRNKSEQYRALLFLLKLPSMCWVNFRGTMDGRHSSIKSDTVLAQWNRIIRNKNWIVGKKSTHSRTKDKEHKEGQELSLVALSLLCYFALKVLFFSLEKRRKNFFFVVLFFPSRSNQAIF